MEIAPILELKEVSVTYRRPDRSRVIAVAGVGLQLYPGEILGLVGESGCGKSTLGKAAVGILPTSEGEVRFNGNVVTPLSRSARSRDLLRLQLIFQDPYSSLNPRRKIGDQLVDGLINSGTSLDEARETSAKLLERVGLSRSTLTKYTHQFSGGQRQRIAIARALTLQPQVIIADEPISALDASAQAQVANLLVELVQEFGMGMVFISHDLSVVRQISDRTAVMYLGKIVEIAKTDQIWQDPKHPYTKALIQAIPKPDGKGSMPRELLGDVPNPQTPPSGCRFHPRCPVAIKECSQIEPVMTITDNRASSCLLNNEVPNDERGKVVS
jgi:peptide/nickel transport system ATP-binding protein